MEYTDAVAMVQRLYSRIDARRAEITKREEYYAGKQPLSFATAEWKNANAARYAGFSDNWTRPVVDAEAERIQHTGIKLDDNDAGAKALWESWLVNEMEMQSSQGFVTSLATSRSFVLVWGDNDDEPVMTWEHPASVEIEYDWANRRRRVAALKTWADERVEYATLYLPDEVWKFQRPRVSVRDERASQAEQGKVPAAGSSGWAPRVIPTEPNPQPNPMGVVPMVEVPNRPILAGDPVSEISGVVSMQDAINLLWAYLFLAADYASMPARVVLGTAPPKIPILDANGVKIGDKPVELKDLAEKRLLYVQDPDVKIDSWEAARLDVFTGVIETAIAHIAAQTRTPPTYLLTMNGMSNVSADGLKASEIGLVKKTLEFFTFATPAIREVHRLGALAKGDQALAQQVRTATISFANPEIRSEAQLADALLKKKSLGYPIEYLMELDGIAPHDIDRIKRMREDEMWDPQIAAAMRPVEGVDPSAAPILN